jgi:hypothetical protein
MIRSASTPGSIRSTTVETPRRAHGGSRLLTQLLLGRRVLRGVADDAGRIGRPRPSLIRGRLGGLTSTLDEAHGPNIAGVPAADH